MNFVERIINEVEREERAAKNGQKITGNVEIITIKITTENGDVIPGVEERIVREIGGRRIITSSFVNMRGAVYYMAICKK